MRLCLKKQVDNSLEGGRYSSVGEYLLSTPKGLIPRTVNTHTHTLF